jgi:cytidyltransferase-like protein
VISGYLSSAFDLLNVGDLDLIAQARQRCDHLVVGVHSDEYVERVTGRAPVVPLVERMALVGHIRGVDAVIMHDDADQPELGSTDTVFRVAESADHRHDHRVHRLAPTRQTESRAIRAALAPQARTGVA